MLNIPHEIRKLFKDFCSELETINPGSYEEVSSKSGVDKTTGKAVKITYLKLKKPLA